MLSSELRNLILSNKKDCALLIGNGINRYANSGCSWNDLLKALAKAYCHSDFDSVPEGISNTEFFDSLEISILKNTPTFDKEKFFQQNVSLGKILQQDSSKIFEQIQKLALNQPFKLDDLSRLPNLSSNISFSKEDELNEMMTITELGDKLRPAVNSSMLRGLCELMQSWKPVNIHKSIASFAKKNEIPILTTNYDSLLGDAVKAHFHDFGSGASSEIHPISCCYTTKRKPDVAKFGIWHINGMIKYPKSILIGLSHYIRALENIRKNLFLPNKYNAEIFQGNHWGFTSLSNTWVNLIFSRSLFITGLSLETDEVLLRWLLLERAKYYALFPYKQKKGWYIIRQGDQISPGKKCFLKSVGIEIIQVPDYDAMYNALSL